MNGQVTYWGGALPDTSPPLAAFQTFATRLRKDLPRLPQQLALMEMGSEPFLVHGGSHYERTDAPVDLRDCLPMFLTIPFREDPASAVVRFVEEYGALYLCGHGLGRWRSSPPHKFKDCLLCDWPDDIYVEPVDGWIAYARQVGALLAIAADFQWNREPRAEDLQWLPPVVGVLDGKDDDRPMPRLHMVLSHWTRLESYAYLDVNKSSLGMEYRPLESGGALGLLRWQIAEAVRDPKGLHRCFKCDQAFRTRPGKRSPRKSAAFRQFCSNECREEARREDDSRRRVSAGHVPQNKSRHRPSDGFALF